MLAVILAAALTALATACSSSSSSGASAAVTATGSSNASASASASASAAGTGKLTGTAVTTLLAKAIANTKAAPSLEVKDAGVSSGTADQTTSFDLTLVRNVGCQGTMAQLTTETMKLVVTDGSVWLKPSNAFYASLKFSQAKLALVADKWIKMKSTDAEGASLSQLCSFSYLFRSMKAPTGTSFVATPTTYGGQSAYKVTVPGQQGYAYVTNSATPMLAKLAIPGSGGVITFTAYGTTPAITAPSAAESIDGSALGF